MDNPLMKGGFSTLIETQIIVVEPGTEIAKDMYGEPLIVTDEKAVLSGCTVWVTEKVLQGLRENTSEIVHRERRASYQRKIVERE